MFRCKGYEPASEFRKFFAIHRLREKVRDVISEKADRQAAIELLREERGRSPDYTEEEIQDRIGYLTAKERADMRERLNFFAFRSVLYATPLYLCGADEHVVQVGKEILSGRGRFIDEREGGRSFDLLSRDFLTVDVSELAELINALELVQRSKFLAMNMMNRRASEFISYKPIVQNLLPLQGYALSMKKDQLPETDDEILGHFGVFKKDSAISQTRIGRPRKQEQALEAYLDRFPNGHEGYAWKQVLRILEDECGVKVSQDTLSAALKSHEEDDELAGIMPEKGN